MSYKKFAIVPYELYKSLINDQSTVKVSDKVSSDKVSPGEMGQLNCSVAVNKNEHLPLIDTSTSLESENSLGSGIVASSYKSTANSDDSKPAGSSVPVKGKVGSNKIKENRHSRKEKIKKVLKKIANKGKVGLKKIKKNRHSPKEKVKKVLKKIAKKTPAANMNWLKLFVH